MIASDHWERHIRETRVDEGGYEYESFTADIGEAPELIAIFPLVLAADVLGLVITLPISIGTHLFSFDEVQEYTAQQVTPVVDLAVRVTSGSWAVSGKTNAEGVATLDLRQPAVLALQGGNAMSYTVLVDGQADVDESLSIADTVAWASPPAGDSLADRFAYWQALLAKCREGDARQAVTRQVDRVDPKTLAAFQSQQGLPSSMSLPRVELYRDQIERHARANGAKDHATASEALQAMASLMNQHDSAQAKQLKARSVKAAAAYVVDYYSEHSLRSTPTFMVDYCNRNLAAATRHGDSESAGIFASVQAARSGDESQLRAGAVARNHPAVASMQQRARKEIQRQREETRRQRGLALWRAAEERRTAEEEAWHYRYLNGRGGRSPVGSGGNFGSTQTTYRGTAGPSVADQARAHREWRQLQDHNAANRNRAFNQTRRN